MSGGKKPRTSGSGTRARENFVPAFTTLYLASGDHFISSLFFRGRISPLRFFFSKNRVYSTSLEDGESKISRANL